MSISYDAVKQQYVVTKTWLIRNHTAHIPKLKQQLLQLVEVTVD